MSSAEKDQYDKGVDVYFQASAWMDSQLNQEWVKRTLITGIGTSPHEKVIFADNVGFQQEKHFHEMCRKEINAIIYLLTENLTDKVQPIDAGFGKQMNIKIGEAMEKWLEEDQNLDLWHDRLSAKQRRFLMTQCTGKARRKLSSEKIFAKKLFKKTGCLMTADSSDDDMIKPQGLEPYYFYFIFVFHFPFLHKFFMNWVSTLTFEFSLEHLGWKALKFCEEFIYVVPILNFVHRHCPMVQKEFILYY